MECDGIEYSGSPVECFVLRNAFGHNVFSKRNLSMRVLAAPKIIPTVYFNIDHSAGARLAMIRQMNQLTWCRDTPGPTLEQITASPPAGGFAQARPRRCRFERSRDPVAALVIVDGLTKPVSLRRNIFRCHLQSTNAAGPATSALLLEPQNRRHAVRIEPATQKPGFAAAAWGSPSG